MSLQHLNPNKMMTSHLMMASTIMAINSTSWIYIWVALEINLITFLPLSIMSPQTKEVTAALMYFLVQATSSSLLLLSMLMTNLFYNSNSLMSLIFIIAILTKLGAAPSHLWFPQVMNMFQMPISMILATWQKLTPLILLAHMDFKIKNILWLIIIINALIGSIGGINQTQVRSLMAYSSITHMAWMFTSMFYSSSSTMLYLAMYSLLTSSFMMMSYLSNKMMTKDFNPIFSWPQYLNIIMFLNLLSMAGIPPLTGFMPKMMIIYQTANELFPIILILILSTMISAYYYLSLFFFASWSSQKSLYPLSSRMNLTITALTPLLLMPIFMLMM